MKQVKSKRKTNGLLVFSICLLVVAIITSLTFALFTDYKRSETQITFGKIQIDAGKTIVNTNVANLLPGSPVLSDKVVVAKDAFSESYILRAKHSFTLGESVTSPQNFQTYLDILSGESFNKVDAYGRPVYADENWYSYDDTSKTYTQLYIQTDTTPTYAPATTENVATETGVTFYTLGTDGSTYTEATGVTAVRQPEVANGFILTTQAVDGSGNIWASVYNASTGEYESEMVDLDGDTTQDTVKEGYAQNYRWFYLDGYFYLCEWFADGDEDTLAETVRIKNVERAELAETEVTIDGATNSPFDLTTETGRENLLDYYDNVLPVTPSGAAAGTLTSFKTALDTAKTNYTDAVSAFNIAKGDYTKAYDNTIKALTALKSAQANVNLTDTNLEAYNTFNDALMAYLNSNDPDAEFVYTTDNTSNTQIYQAYTKLNNLGATGNVDAYLTKVASIVTTKDNELTNLANRNNAADAVDSALDAFNKALANYSEARDLVAKEMKDYQELYVFALGGDEYNTIPTDLYQLENYAQYNTEFILNLEFNAVQSENLRLADSDTDLDLAQTTVANLVQFFAAE